MDLNTILLGFLSFIGTVFTSCAAYFGTRVLSRLDEVCAVLTAHGSRISRTEQWQEDHERFHSFLGRQVTDTTDL